MNPVTAVDDCTYQTKMFVNKVWLDNLGMKIPATTDEFYEILKAHMALTIFLQYCR